MKEQFADRHVAPHGHTMHVPSQPDFENTPNIKN